MSVINISGKIGSGKDLTGRIIQYLTLDPKEFSMNTKDIVADITIGKGYCASKSSYKIVKFADALKDIIVILTGCTREQLEDNDFKDSKLPDEWIRYGYADGFIKQYIGNGEMSGAIMNNKQCSKDEYEEHFKTNWQTAYKAHLTYRELLQQLGTNLFRDKLHEDVWINALFSKYKGVKQTTISKDCPRQGVYDVTEQDELQYGNIETIYPRWIITDCRFPNELARCKEHSFVSIKINRPRYCEGCTLSHLESQDCFDCIVYQEDYNLMHESETALDNAEFDYIIDNNGTIEELIDKVKQILIIEKVI